MKKAAIFVILLLCVVGAAQAAVIEVLYEDTFDSDGLGTNTGIGGGAVNRTIRSHSWVDDGDATFAVTDNVHFLNRALMYSDNAFQSDTGFKLTVYYTASAVGDDLANRLSFGLLRSDRDPATYNFSTTNENVSNPFGVEATVYSLGVNVTQKDGQGLKFTDRSSVTTLDASGDNAQFVAGDSIPVVIEIGPNGAWSYSINGITEASGAIAGGFDLTQSYYVAAYAQDDEYARSIQSVKLEALGPVADSPVTFDNVFTALDLMPAVLSATVTNPMTRVDFTLLTDDIDFPAGADASLANDSPMNYQNPGTTLTTTAPGTYKVLLQIGDGVRYLETIAEVVIYADACEAQRYAPSGWNPHPYDFDQNCLVGLPDLAVFVAAWLNDTSLDSVAEFAAVWLDDTSLDSQESYSGPVSYVPKNTTEFNEFTAEMDGETARFQVYIPASVEHVKAAFYISQHGQGDITHPVLHQFAKDENLALVGFFGDPVQRGVADVSVLDEHIATLADLSEHPELPDAPIMTFGHSNGTGFAACWPRDRTDQVICWTSFHPGFTGYLQYANTEFVPALVMCGELDDYFLRSRQDITVAAMRSTRNAAMAMMLEGGMSHSMPYKDDTWTFIVEFCKAAMRIRLNGDGTLNPVDIEAGWLGEQYDVETGGRQLLDVAPYADFTGDPSTANWLADQTFAEHWESYGSTEAGQWLE